MNYEKKYICSICGYWVYMLTDEDGIVHWLLEHPTKNHIDPTVVHLFDDLTDMYEYARTYPILDGDSLV